MTNDGSLGVGEQMAVLEVVQSNLVDEVPGWVSAVKGTGKSRGDVTAGTGGSANSRLHSKPITTADLAGAGILTFLVLAGVIGGTTVMFLD